MPDPTTNYGWNLPNVGGDAGAWGTLLNDILNDIDTELAAVAALATAALPASGGSTTGIVNVYADRYEVTDLGNITGAVAIDTETGNFFICTVTGNVTFSFTNPPTVGRAAFITLEITNGGAFVVTWPASMEWPGGTAPTLQAAGIDVITMYTRDGGTTWRGALAMGQST